MKQHLARFGIVALCMTTSVSALAQSACPTAAEARAERTRILQTELMVAALKCRGRPELGLYEKYNAFVQKFTPQLVEHGKTLTAYFSRAYGPDYRSHMDKYITSLANTVSMASDRDPDFCDASFAQANAVLDESPGSISLASFEIRNVDAMSLSACRQADEDTTTADATTAVPVE